MNIVVWGLDKTGTTALFYKIENSFYGDVLFEPDEERLRHHIQSDMPLLVKNLRLPLMKYFDGFDKKVLIVRDPRDRLISWILYRAGFYSMKNYSPRRLGHCMDILRKKEKDPDSISVLDICEEIFGRGKEYFQVSEKRSLDRIMEGASKYGGHVFQYDDLIGNRFAELGDYLGMDIAESPARVDKEYRRVARTKSSGSWRNWFTEDDVVFFRPIYHDFMCHFGYDDDWKVNPYKKIFPSHCSEYVEKLLKEAGRSIEGMGARAIGFDSVKELEKSNEKLSDELTVQKRVTVFRGSRRDFDNLVAKIKNQ
jgi:hypothetical protein